VSAKGWLVGGGAVLLAAGGTGVLLATGVLPGLVVAPVPGAAVTVGAISTGASGPQPTGAAVTLSAALSESGTATADLAAEALIAKADGTIYGLWYQAAHPAGAFSGQWDAPAWFQWRCPAIPPRGSCTARWGTTLGVESDQELVTIVFAAPVPAGYTGPLVKGKVPGGQVSALVDAVPGGAAVLVVQRGPTFEV
jgi:hypothetical protein